MRQGPTAARRRVIIVRAMRALSPVPTATAILAKRRCCSSPFQQTFRGEVANGLVNAEQGRIPPGPQDHGHGFVAHKAQSDTHDGRSADQRGRFQDLAISILRRRARLGGEWGRHPRPAAPGVSPRAVRSEGETPC